MKKIVWLLLTAAGLLFSADIVWQKDMQTAFALAEKENKLVMVMVEGEHCRWCKKMRYRTLGDEGVIEKLQKHYVSVRVDELDKAAMKILPPVKGVPTIFFLYPNKKVIERVTGYYKADDFMSYLKEIDRKVWQVKE